jgi:hypothetical protein
LKFKKDDTWIEYDGPREADGKFDKVTKNPRL